jgi:hypothetical protein
VQWCSSLSRLSFDCSPSAALSLAASAAPAAAASSSPSAAPTGPGTQRGRRSARRRRQPRRRWGLGTLGYCTASAAATSAPCTVAI